MARTPGNWCPFSPADLKKCRTLLKLPGWKLAREIRTITGTKIKPVDIINWERGVGRPGKVVSLALVKLFTPVWYGDAKALEIEAWWASNEVSKEAARRAKKSTKKKKWTTPLTNPDGGVYFDVPQWRPGTKKPN